MKILSFLFICVILVSCENENYPYYIKSDDHGVLWVANASDNTITCIDRVNDEKIGTYAVGPSPSRTAVDLKGDCWVGSRGDGTVYFVTQQGNVRKFSGFNAVRGVALDKAGNVWIANSGNNTIQKISLPDTIISAQVDLPDVAGYYYGALVDGNNYFWILDQTANRMIKYNTAKFPDPNACEIIQMPNKTYGFTIDENNTVWVAGHLSPYLYKIDAAKAAISDIDTIPSNLFGGSVCGVTFDIYGKIWITNDNANSVLRFDPGNKTFTNFPVNGTNPHGLGSDDEGYVYTINNASNDISKINVKNGKVETIYKVGNGPYTYSDLTGFIYRHVTLKNK